MKKQVALWSVIILIAVPFIVYGLSEVSFLPVTGGNDWAGFLGRVYRSHYRRSNYNACPLVYIRSK